MQSVLAALCVSTIRLPSPNVTSAVVGVAEAEAGSAAEADLAADAAVVGSATVEAAVVVAVVVASAMAAVVVVVATKAGRSPSTRGRRSRRHPTSEWPHTCSRGLLAHARLVGFRRLLVREDCTPIQE